jgi:hypothetical protein
LLTKVSVVKKLCVPGDRTWEAVRRFGRLEVWFPTIAACTIEGEGVGARRLTYQRIRSPFPVSSYRGTVEVFESFDSRAVVAWTVDFESDPQDSPTVAETLRAGIGAGIDGMERDLLNP